MILSKDFILIVDVCYATVIIFFLSSLLVAVLPSEDKIPLFSFSLHFFISIKFNVNYLFTVRYSGFCMYTAISLIRQRYENNRNEKLKKEKSFRMK